MKTATCSLDFVWGLLLLGTGLTWWLGESGHVGPGAVTTILVIAAVKGVFVIREFMAMRGVRLLWQAVVIGWLLVALAANLAAYWKGI